MARSTWNERFWWAVGIEDTFIPDAPPGMRSLDEYELTHHYRLWRRDFELLSDLGVGAVRWGIPWYRVNPAPGVFEWGWVDDCLDDLVRGRGVVPIVDLLHYGTPAWLDASFANPDYPKAFGEYVAAVVERYRGLSPAYTPTNEPVVNADFCGRRGVWPPYRTGDEGHVEVLMAVVKGMVAAVEAIRAADPAATLVQVEALGWSHTADPSLHDLVEDERAHRYLAYDLFSGRVDDAHPLWAFLRSNGAEDEDLAMLAGEPRTVDVLGVNLYPWAGNELIRGEDGEVRRSGELSGGALAKVLRDAWERYRLPLMITETSSPGDDATKLTWLEETVSAIGQARAEGVAVTGYTWFPLFTMIDWDYRLGDGPIGDYLLELGLYRAAPDQGWERRPTPLVDRFRQLVRDLPDGP